MKSYPTKFKSFLWKIVQMGTLQKLQNSIQTLLIFWPVYPIHTNSLFWVIFVELQFSHFPHPNTSVHGKDSKIQSIFYLNILVFQTNGKQSYSFPVLSRFCNGLLRSCKLQKNKYTVSQGIKVLSCLLLSLNIPVGYTFICLISLQSSNKVFCCR